MTAVNAAEKFFSEDKDRPFEAKESLIHCSAIVFTQSRLLFYR